MKNTSGAQVVAGDILILKAVAAGDEVTTTTIAGDNGLLRGGGFMALETIADAAYGRFLRRGFTNALKVNGTTDIAIGDRLTSFTSAGIAKKAAVGDPYFATALEAYATNDSLGVIDAILTEPGAEDPSASSLTSPVALADGGTGQALTDPGADRITFWDDSETKIDWLTIGTGLSITGTTISASGATS